MAAEAETILGDPLDMIPEAEFDVRVFNHDILRPHHDRDFHQWATHPRRTLETHVLVVIRMTYDGTLYGDRIVGRRVPDGAVDQAASVRFVIHCGHMRHLVVRPAMAKRLLALFRHRKVEVVDVVASGSYVTSLGSVAKVLGSGNRPGPWGW